MTRDKTTGPDLEELALRVEAARLRLQEMRSILDELFPEDWQLPEKRSRQWDEERGFGV